MHRSKRSPSFNRRARASSAARALVIALAAITAISCGSPAPSVEAPASSLPPRGARIQFEFTTIDDKPLSTETLAGRISVIGFIATYDARSQGQARFLEDLLRRHKPRLNVAVLVLEPAENKPLVEAFTSSLGLSYPVAFADAATIAGTGPFTGLHHVPSVVILDRQGKEAWRYFGLVEASALEVVVREVERTSGSP
jgi:hypothetical protein